MTGFSESPEYRKKQVSEVTTSVAWILLLKRSPTTAEFNATVARLDAATPASTIIRDLFRGTELSARVA